MLCNNRAVLSSFPFVLDFVLAVRLPEERQRVEETKERKVKEAFPEDFKDKRV